MKVNLAVQIFSRSVAKSLKFCREVLKLPEFSESEPTEEFLLVVNDIFDILNSRSPKGIKCRAPLRESNQQYWSPCFEKTKEFFMGLTNGHTDKSLVRNDPKKAGFLGIICNIEAHKKIFTNVVLNGPLHYLLTYKLSQDHIILA